MNSNQSNLECTEAVPIVFQTVLSKEQFKEFCMFIDIIKLHFTDFCMVDGTFRMRSDDKVAIVETEFHYLKGANLNIIDTKLLVKMLSTLSKKTPITLTMEEDTASFTDGYQSVKVYNYSSLGPDDQFVSDDQMREILESNMDPDRPFLKQTLAKPLVFNIKKVSKELKTEFIAVQHIEGELNRGCLYVNNKCAYASRSDYAAREYTIELENDFLCPMPMDHYFRVSSLPFIFDKSNMFLDFYLNDNVDRMVMATYRTSIDGLLINIYGRALIQSKD
jgi:hypothetical protein